MTSRIMIPDVYDVFSAIRLRWDCWTSSIHGEKANIRLYMYVNYVGIFMSSEIIIPDI